MLGDDFINQHICLFLAGSQLDEKKQKEFFYRMCTALGYDDDKMMKLSKIYSIYGLFGSKPLLIEDLYTLKRLSPCKGCSALRRKAIYKHMEFYNKACPLCLFSENYQNAREHDEIVVLRHLMKPDSQYEYYQVMSENAFTSLSRLCPDYAIGDYPIIPFNLFLYRFLEKYHYAESERKLFFKEYMQFVMNQMDTVINMEMHQESLEMLFNAIIRIDEQAVSQDIYELSASKLKQQYKYNPPMQTIKPMLSGNPGQKPRQRRRSVRHSEPKNQSSIFNLAGIKGQVTQDADTYTDAPAETAILPSPQSLTSEKNAIPAEKDDIGMPDITELDNVMGIADPISTDENNVSTSDLSISKEAPSNIGHNSTLIRHNAKFHQSWFNHIFKNSTELYTCTSLSDAFMQEINYLERKDSFKFISMLEKNYGISLEPMLMHGREGMLIHLPAQNEFFFYDISIFGKEMLTTYLARPSIFSITYNSMGTLGLLTDGFGCPDYIWGMDAAEWSLNPSKHPNFKQIIEDNAHQPVQDSNFPDPLAFAMPLYRKVYFSQKRRLEKKRLIKDYAKSMRLLGVLSKSLKLHEIFYGHKPYFTGTAFMQYEYHFDWHDMPSRPGQIFRISIPFDITIQEGIRLDSFLADVLLCFCGLHHSNENRVYLVSVSSKAIYYFFSGSYEQSLHFYDTMIARIQKRYFNRFHKPINTASTFISYE